MSTSYSIGRLADAGGVPISTVRYYERIGLLAPAGRTEGNYRYYGAAALERLRFIRAAQTTGLTLEDIATLLGFRDGDTAPCDEVEALIDHRLADVKERMVALRNVQRVLTSLKQVCEATVDADHCAVMDELSAASRPAQE